MIDAGNRDICAIRANGTGFMRLTSDPGSASCPRFSVDGSKIGFGNPDWVVINADGTGITAATPGDFAVAGRNAERLRRSAMWWGCQADGHICSDTIYISNIDGTFTAIAFGNNPAWALSPRADPLAGVPRM